MLKWTAKRKKETPSLPVACVGGKKLMFLIAKCALLTQKEITFVKFYHFKYPSLFFPHNKNFDKYFKKSDEYCVNKLLLTIGYHNLH